MWLTLAYLVIYRLQVRRYISPDRFYPSIPCFFLCGKPVERTPSIWGIVFTLWHKARRHLHEETVGLLSGEFAGGDAVVTSHARLK